MTGRAQTLILGILVGAFAMYVADRAPEFYRQQERQRPVELTMSNPEDLDREMRRRLEQVAPQAPPPPLEGLKPCSPGSRLCWLLQ